jgi:hypothetical protein
MADVYSFERGPVLKVSGSSAARRHFHREYGSALTAEDLPASVEIDFGGGDRQDAAATRPWLSGGHKTMRWSVRLGDPTDEVLWADFRMRGLPKGFGLSLVQSFYVEPLMSVAAARAGSVLLPAAAFAIDGRALILVGLSGSGKTSLSMQALARGCAVLGDDQVLLTPDGFCRPFPRRMRLYPDIETRVPLAYEKLPGSVKAQLRLRQAIRLASGGWISPSLVLGRDRVSAEEPTGALPVGAIAMLVRSPSSGDFVKSDATTGEAIDYAIEAIREQRRRLAACGDDWAATMAETEGIEAGLLGHAFACAPATRVIVPTPIGSGQMLDLGSALGLPAIGFSVGA